MSVAKLIGLLGGTFDPVHKQHVEIANTACEQLSLDCVHMIPSAQPPHRSNTQASAEQRLEMLQLAIQDYPKLLADDCELRRTGPSYTIDTLRQIKANSPAAHLVFLLGADAYLSLPEWHAAAEMREYCHFVVAARPGHQLPDLPEANNAMLQSVSAGTDSLLSLPAVTESASDIRQRLVNQANASTMAGLDPRVLDYIQQHELYTT